MGRTQHTRVAIDSTDGGSGDIWMRLVALHAMGRIRPEIRCEVALPPHLVGLATQVFSERIEIGARPKYHYRYGSQGAKYAATHAWRGNGRLILPFYWIQQRGMAGDRLRRAVGNAVVSALDLVGAIGLPPRATITTYEGFMEVAALPPFARVSYAAFRAAAAADFPGLQERFARAARGPETEEVVVFPSGTTHQIMPPDWAAAHLPQATYAFHVRDGFGGEFERRGLRTRRFETVEELVAAGAAARRIVSTDSFPSHLWQLATKPVLLVLTQRPAEEVVHPAFPRANVVDSVAACCPCRNVARGPRNHPCQAGHEYCVTWNAAGPQHAIKALAARAASA